MIITGAMPAQHFSGVSHRLRWSRQTDHDFAGAVGVPVGDLGQTDSGLGGIPLAEQQPVVRSGSAQYSRSRRGYGDSCIDRKLVLASVRNVCNVHKEIVH
jgi:hypothetical protein